MKMKMEIPNRRLTLRQMVTGLFFGKMSQAALAMVRGLDRFARWSTTRGLVSMGVDRGTAREMVEIAAGGGEVTVTNQPGTGSDSGWTEIGKTPGGGTVYVAGTDAIDAMRSLLSGDCLHCDHYHNQAKPCCFCGGVVLLS